MAALCVAVGAASAVVQDDTCAQNLVLVDMATYQAIEANPLILPMDVVWTLAPALLALIVTAFLMKASRKALD